MPTQQIGRGLLPFRRLRRLLAVAAQPAALAQLQGQPARLLEPVALPRHCSCSACSPSSSPTTSRSSPATRARCCSRCWSTIPESKFGGFLAVTDYKDPVILDEIAQNGWAHVAADQLLLPLDQQGLSARQECERPVPGLPGAAALGVQRASCAMRRPTRSRATGASATATGSAPTTRAATCWRA